MRYVVPTLNCDKHLRPKRAADLQLGLVEAADLLADREKCIGDLARWRLGKR
jgi:hypothetical protein